MPQITGSGSPATSESMLAGDTRSQGAEMHLVSGIGERLPKRSRDVLTGPRVSERFHRQAKLIVVEELLERRSIVTGRKLNPGSGKVPPRSIPACDLIIARHNHRPYLEHPRPPGRSRCE
jgi:hypothetical protein